MVIYMWCMSLIIALSASVFWCRAHYEPEFFMFWPLIVIWISALILWSICRDRKPEDYT